MGIESDAGHQLTEKELTELEKRIRREYKRANKEVEAKLNNYLASFDRKDKEKKKQLKAGIITQSQYNDWRTGQILIGDRWREMLDTLSTDYLNADKIARQMTDETLPNVYAVNHNYATFQVEKESLVNTSYTLYDHATVERLIKTQPELLPELKEDSKTAQAIRDGKVKRWNQQKITAEVTQGILQGESIQKISKRLRRVTDMDYKVSIRNARSAYTGAQNAGRVDAYKRAENMGIDLLQEWIAVPDNRTRHAHRLLDGQRVKVGEPFKVDGYDIEYPGDKKAPAYLYYNCRCTIAPVLKGFEHSTQELGLTYSDELGTMTYDEWKNGRQLRKKHIEKQNIDFTKLKSNYTAVATISEAENYANAFVSGGFNLTGKSVSYKGISIENANIINQRLTDIYDNFDIEKMSSIESFGKANKKIFQNNSDAPMFTTNYGNIGLNSTIIKDKNTVQRYITDGEESFDYVIKNMDALKGTQLEIAMAYKEAGKTLVGNSLEDMITHEIGHHISYMPEVNKKLSEIQKTDWKKYSRKLSGYANHSFGEYTAESFNAFYRGNYENLQPEMIELFESIRRK